MAYSLRITWGRTVIAHRLCLDHIPGLIYNGPGSIVLGISLARIYVEILWKLGPTEDTVLIIDFMVNLYKMSATTN